MTTMCPKTVVGGRQGHAPCEVLLFQQSLFLCQLNVMEIIRMSQSSGDSGYPLEDITGFKTVMCVCLSYYVVSMWICFYYQFSDYFFHKFLKELITVVIYAILVSTNLDTVFRVTFVDDFRQ